MLPLLDHVVMDTLACQILVTMLDLIDILSRKPMHADLLHIFLSKLLEAHDHHVVVHAREFATIVIRHGC